MVKNPKVTILMPVYNGEKYLREAIESILNQSFADFELLVINDGSTDSSVKIIEAYSDFRIRLVHNEKNLKLIATLNKGIDLARGEYIARMDCDDVSHPERLEKQVKFMDSHPEIGICSSWADYIDETGNVIGQLQNPTGDLLQKTFWRPSPIIHAACMAKSNLFRENKFDPEYCHAEDYELWLRLYEQTKFFNIDEYLYRIRFHGDRVSVQQREFQLKNSYRAFCDFTGSSKISYRGFLSLIFVNLKLNPFTRTYYYLLASAKTGLHWKKFMDDNFDYLCRWTRHNRGIIRKIILSVLRKIPGIRDILKK